MNPKEPINDALPGQPLTAFQMIREIVNKFPATSRKKPAQGSCLGRKRTCHE